MVFPEIRCVRHSSRIISLVLFINTTADLYSRFDWVWRVMTKVMFFKVVLGNLHNINHDNQISVVYLLKSGISLCSCVYQILWCLNISWSWNFKELNRQTSLGINCFGKLNLFIHSFWHDLGTQIKLGSQPYS